MDFFGIGPALSLALSTYIQTARRSGRTSRLLAHVESGDRIICLQEQEARRLRNALREAGKDVEVIPLPVDKLDQIICGPRPHGRVYFDHTLIEAYYADELKRSGARLECLRQAACGRRPQELGYPQFYEPRD